MRKGRKALPIRHCLKRTGPRESSLIRMATITKRGDRKKSPPRAIKKSKARFIAAQSSTKPSGDREELGCTQIRRYASLEGLEFLLAPNRPSQHCQARRGPKEGKASSGHTCLIQHFALRTDQRQEYPHSRIFLLSREVQPNLGSSVESRCSLS